MEEKVVEVLKISAIEAPEREVNKTACGFWEDEEESQTSYK